MTVTRVRNTATGAVSDHRLDLRETRRVVDAAGATVSSSEARVLGDLFEGLSSKRPGTSEQPYATRGARKHLDELFQRMDLPYGTNRADVVRRLVDFFDAADLGTPLEKAPRSSSLVAAVLREDGAGGVRETAFVHAVSRKTYLRIDRPTDGANKAHWYGPFDPKVALPTPVTPTPVTPTPVAPTPVAPTPVTPTPIARPGPGEPSVVSYTSGLHADRSHQLTNLLDGIVNARRTTYNLDELPPGMLLHVGARTTRGSYPQYRVTELLLVDDGRPFSELGQYYLRVSGGGNPTKHVGPFDAPAPVSPMEDGLLTMPGRARNFFYKLYFEDNFQFTPTGPAASVKLARGTRVADFHPYFVIPTKADGTLDDPDRASQVYFRNIVSGDWTGPYTMP